MLPSGLPDLVGKLTATGTRDSERKNLIVSALTWRPKESRVAFVDCRSAEQFTFIPYLPQAVGIACGRAFGASPLMCFYLARLDGGADQGFSQFTTWTPYGADFIAGLQGRYFIPVAPVAALVLHSERFCGLVKSERLSVGLVTFSAIVYAIALDAVINRYYGE